VTSQLIERGLQAWSAGDLDTLETVFDPAVTLRSVEPGEWDCVGREELMWLLRQRQSRGSTANPGDIEVVDEHTVIVTSTQPTDVEGQQPFRVATRVTVVGGKVIAMDQSRTENPGGGTD
jgi:ketosteroid isomerase-like protein